LFKKSQYSSCNPKALWER